MCPSDVDPDSAADAAPSPIPLVVTPVFVAIRAYTGTSYGGYPITYYRVDLICRSEGGQWQAERCLLVDEHWLAAVHRCADRAAEDHGVEIHCDFDE